MMVGKIELVGGLLEMRADSEDELGGEIGEFSYAYGMRILTKFGGQLQD